MLFKDQKVKINNPDSSFNGEQGKVSHPMFHGTKYRIALDNFPQLGDGVVFEAREVVPV